MSTESLDQLSDLSLISDCSYHSDSDQDQVEPVFQEERKPVVRRQKNQNNSHQSDSDQDRLEEAVFQQKLLERERDAFVQITIILLVMLSVAVFFLLRNNPNQTTESAPTTTNITNTNGTFNPTEYMKTFGERRMMKTSEILGDQEKLAKAQRAVESKRWSKLGDVPEYYWDKFVPDITRFEGVDAYLHKTKQNGTQVEEALYFHPIKFVKINMRGTIDTTWPSLNHGIFDMVNVDSCDPKTECLKSTYQIEKGDLVFEHTFTMDGGQKMFVKTVYYIPAETFI
ncbi:hypothetical protein GCK72_021634 [Caenorhabditis remanei]|uniref:Uncharacterized protein n=1 Tax=Caenorhabditis remanei TaxID=31234 RepID=A0A6A5GKD7_CAERE|nr:hypothetical protein GCK72_021634 [Caenorhabditis remanei]KAF1755066.1 hypothetical protein GCK72_021634 [Caenorhabditis remanei]